jgi:hypothetical protein
MFFFFKVFGMMLKPGEPYETTVQQFVTLRLTNTCLTPDSFNEGSLYFLNKDEKVTLCHFNEKIKQFHGLNLLFHPQEKVTLGVDGKIIFYSICFLIYFR